jgi:catechol 2,3-dioxygenase-like lactoylglutathione lyase family enzyme
MAESVDSATGLVLTHFIVSRDVERSRRFYTDVLGGETVLAGEPTYVALANSWIIINVGGGPTDDKPDVTLETPPDRNLVSSFLNIRVADIHAMYAEWSARGAEFLRRPSSMRPSFAATSGTQTAISSRSVRRRWRSAGGHRRRGHKPASVRGSPPFVRGQRGKCGGPRL